jgi:hypothetical protein
LFFLNTYTMINMTAGLEKLIRNPSFRPRFNVPWPVSLLGGLGCYAAMIVIHPSATVIAVLVCYGIFFPAQTKIPEPALGRPANRILGRPGANRSAAPSISAT